MGVVFSISQSFCPGFPMPPGPRLDGLSVAEGNKTGNPRAWIPRWQCLLACPVLAVLFWEPSWLQFLALDEQPGMEKEGKKKKDILGKQQLEFRWIPKPDRNGASEVSPTCTGAIDNQISPFSPPPPLRLGAATFKFGGGKQLQP